MIDTAALAESLPRRRWFGHKGRALAGVEIVDEGVLDDRPPPLVAALARVDFADGEAALYHLPLILDPDGALDAFERPERLGVLGELMARAHSIKGTHGVFNFEGPGLDPLAPPGASARVLGAEQSNSSVVLDDSVVLKVFRRVQAGTHPEIELTRLLTAEAFPHVPAHVGEILYSGTLGGRDVEYALGVAQQLVPDAEDGWESTLAELRTLVGRGDAAGSRPQAVPAELVAPLEQLGDVTASLHVALARDDLVPELAAEPVTRSDLDLWTTAVVDAFDRIAHPELEPLRPALIEKLSSLDRLEDAGSKTRIHGDYHLGQVVRSARGWMILDFEGEPARPLAARRVKQSPLRDVAGMLRSFGYAATSALLEVPEDERAGAAPRADAWEAAARGAFLAAYRRRSHEGRFLPAQRSSIEALLEVFEIDKALYELAYELANRPDWSALPLRGIRRALAAT